MNHSQASFAPKYLLTVIALLSAGALVFALVAQHLLGMQPCAWCIFQRLLVLGFIALAILGLILVWLKLYYLVLGLSFILLITGIGGIYTAWHQFSFAAKSFSCELTFADKLISYLGLEQLAPSVFGIYATCMDAQVNLFGIDFALWSLGFFVVVAILAFVLAWFVQNEIKKQN